MADPCPWPVNDRGSALLLIPAAVLIVVLLGSLAVDSAIVFTAQRQLADAAAAAANDAVTAGLAEDAFYRCEGVRLNPERVREVVVASLEARAADIVDAVQSVSTGHDAAGVPTVTVHVEGSVTPLFAPALPGGGTMRTVEARAVASAVRQHAVLENQQGCE